MPFLAASCCHPFRPGPPASPSVDFKVTHALSHHLFPNLACDFETCNYVSQGPYSYTNEANTVGAAYPLAPLVMPIASVIGAG
eukprot:gene50299-44844_t